MDLENLIKLVKPFDFLYNQENKDFNNMTKKDETWIKIGKTLNQPGKECKRQWNCIRDTYRRILIKKRKNIKNGILLEKLKKWKFEDEMLYFNNFIIEKDSSVMNTIEGLNIHISEKARILKYFNTNNIIIIKQESDEIEDVDVSRNSKNNVIDSFFASIGATVKKFSKYNQAIAKARVLSIIAKMQIGEVPQKLEFEG